MDIGSEDFYVETPDGQKFKFPNKIHEISNFLRNACENMGQDEVVKLGPEIGVTGDVLGFIHKHLIIHDFNPPGIDAEMIKKDLVENLPKKDYDYVKHLEGIDKIPETAKYIKALNVLDIKPLRQVYICIIATEYTLEDRTIEEMNEKFKDLLPEKFKNYVELTQERMDELNKFFPFMQQKEQQKEAEQEEEEEEEKTEEKEEVKNDD